MGHLLECGQAGAGKVSRELRIGVSVIGWRGWASGEQIDRIRCSREHGVGWASWGEGDYMSANVNHSAAALHARQVPPSIHHPPPCFRFDHATDFMDSMRGVVRRWLSHTGSGERPSLPHPPPPHACAYSCWRILPKMPKWLLDGLRPVSNVPTIPYTQAHAWTLGSDDMPPCPPHTHTHTPVQLALALPSAEET